jgi:hypothetical protein
MLVTAPLAAASEVQGLFEKGIIDSETAIPAALHSLGCSANEITGRVAFRVAPPQPLQTIVNNKHIVLCCAEALKRMRERRDSTSLSDTASSEVERAVKMAQAEHTRAGISLIEAQTKKTSADIKVLESQANTNKNDAVQPESSRTPRTKDLRDGAP